MYKIGFLTRINSCIKCTQYWNEWIFDMKLLYAFLCCVYSIRIYNITKYKSCRIRMKSIFLKFCDFILNFTRNLNIVKKPLMLCSHLFHFIISSYWQKNQNRNFQPVCLVFVSNSSAGCVWWSQKFSIELQLNFIIIVSSTGCDSRCGIKQTSESWMSVYKSFHRLPPSVLVRAGSKMNCARNSELWFLVYIRNFYDAITFVWLFPQHLVSSKVERHTKKLLNGYN